MPVVEDVTHPELAASVVTGVRSHNPRTELREDLLPAVPDATAERDAGRLATEPLETTPTA